MHRPSQHNESFREEPHRRLHSQLVLIASLEGQSLVDTIRQAISELIERKGGDGDLAA